LSAADRRPLVRESDPMPPMLAVVGVLQHQFHFESIAGLLTQAGNKVFMTLRSSAFRLFRCREFEAMMGVFTALRSGDASMAMTTMSG